MSSYACASKDTAQRRSVRQQHKRTTILQKRPARFQKRRSVRQQQGRQAPEQKMRGERDRQTARTRERARERERERETETMRARERERDVCEVPVCAHAHLHACLGMDPIRWSQISSMHLRDEPGITHQHVVSSLVFQTRFVHPKPQPQNPEPCTLNPEPGTTHQRPIINLLNPKLQTHENVA